MKSRGLAVLAVEGLQAQHPQPPKKDLKHSGTVEFGRLVMVEMLTKGAEQAVECPECRTLPAACECESRDQVQGLGF